MLNWLIILLISHTNIIMKAAVAIITDIGDKIEKAKPIENKCAWYDNLIW